MALPGSPPVAVAQHHASAGIGDGGPSVVGVAEGLPHAVLVARVQVSVDVEHHCGAGVTGLRGDCIHAHAALDEQRDKRMSEVMETQRRMIGQGLVASGLEVVPRERHLIDRAALRVGEDKIIGSVVGQVIRQHHHQLRDEHGRPGSPVLVSPKTG